MKEIDPKCWHWKLYCFMSQVIAAWNDKPNPEEYGIHDTHIGRCPYMRTIFVWGPLVLLTNLIPISALVSLFYWIPMSMSGGAGIIWTVVTIGSVIGGVILFLLMLAGITELVDRSNARKQHAVPNTPKINQPETMWSLIKEHIGSVKTKLCPILVVKHDK
jgi:hypothetical protein